MIIGSLDQTARWESLYPDFQKVFGYLKAIDRLTLKTGKIVLEEGRIWMNVDEGISRAPESARLEAHNRFIDIQVPLLHEETFGWQSRDHLIREIGPGYDEQKDIIFYNDSPGIYFTLPVGCFVVFFPEDAHAPCIGEGKFKKIVAKLKVE